MVMAVHKHPPSFSFPPAFVFTILPRNQSFGLSLLLSYSWLSLAMDLALDLVHMILEVQKHLKHTQFLFPTALAETFFAQKSIPRAVLALVLLLAVFGAGPGRGLDPDDPGGPEKP